MEQSKKKTLSTKLKELIMGSFFVRLTLLFAQFIEGVAQRSWIYGFLTTYKDQSNYAKKSFFYQIFVEWPRKSVKKLRLFFSGLVENSIARRLLDRCFRGMMSLDMISWGAFLITFGLSVLASSLYLFLLDTTKPFVDINDMIGGACVFTGLFFTTSKEPLAKALTSSKVFHFLLFPVLGLREAGFQVKRTHEQIFLLGFLGIPCGLLTILVSPVYLMAGVVALLGFALVFSVPETGFILLLGAVPFLPTMAAAGLGGITVVAFLFKVLRCKRVLRFQLIDIFVLFFMIILLIMGGVTALYPVDSLKSVALYLIFISTYFVGANGIRNQQLMNKSIVAMVLAAVLSSLLGIYQYFFSSAGAETWLDKELFADIALRVVGPFENPNVFAEYLVLCLPLCVALIFVLRGRGKWAGLFATVPILLALVYTWSRGAWIASIISMAMFFICYKGIALKLALPGLCALPFLPAVLPDSIVNRILSIGNIADSSTSYRVSIWVASVRMIEDIYKTGIGVGQRAFTAVYPGYALSGVAYAPHSHNLYLQIVVDLGILGLICFVVLMVLYFKLILSSYKNSDNQFYKTVTLALALGVLGFLAQGMTDYVWYNYRIYLMFWMLIGLSVGFTRAYFLNSKNGQEVTEYE